MYTRDNLISQNQSQLTELKERIVLAINSAAKKYQSENSDSDTLDTFKVPYWNSRIVDRETIDFSSKNLDASCLNSSDLDTITDIVSTLLRNVDTSRIWYSTKYNLLFEALSKNDQDHLSYTIDNYTFTFTETVRQLERTLNAANLHNNLSQPSYENHDASVGQGTLPIIGDQYSSLEIKQIKPMSLKTRNKLISNLSKSLKKEAGEDLKKLVNDFIVEKINTAQQNKVILPKKRAEIKKQVKKVINTLNTGLTVAESYIDLLTQLYKLTKERQPTLEEVISFLELEETKQASRTEEIKKQIKIAKEVIKNKEDFETFAMIVDDRFIENVNLLTEGLKTYNPRAEFEKLIASSRGFNENVNYAELIIKAKPFKQLGYSFFNYKIELLNKLANLKQALEKSPNDALKQFDNQRPVFDYEESTELSSGFIHSSFIGEQLQKKQMAAQNKLWEQLRNSYNSFYNENIKILIGMTDALMNDLKDNNNIEDLNRKISDFNKQLSELEKQQSQSVSEQITLSNKENKKLITGYTDVEYNFYEEKSLGNMNEVLYLKYEPDTDAKHQIEDLEKEIVGLENGFSVARQQYYAKREASLDKESATFINERLVGEVKLPDPLSLFQIYETVKNHSYQTQVELDQVNTDDIQFDLYDSGEMFHFELDSEATQSLAQHIPEGKVQLSDSNQELHDNTTPLQLKLECEQLVDQAKTNISKYKAIKLQVVELNKKRLEVVITLEALYNEISTSLDQYNEGLNLCIFDDAITQDSQESLLKNAYQAKQSAIQKLTMCETYKLVISAGLIKLKSNQYLSLDEINGIKDNIEKEAKTISTVIENSPIQIVKDTVAKANEHVKARQRCLTLLKSKQAALDNLKTILETAENSSLDFSGATIHTLNIYNCTKQMYDSFINGELLKITELTTTLVTAIELVNNAASGNANELTTNEFNSIATSNENYVDDFINQSTSSNDKYNSDINDLAKIREKEIEFKKEQLINLTKCLQLLDNKIREPLWQYSTIVKELGKKSDLDGAPLTRLYRDELKPQHDLLMGRHDELKQNIMDLKIEIASFFNKDGNTSPLRANDICIKVESLQAILSDLRVEVINFTALNHKDASDYFKDSHWQLRSLQYWEFCKLKTTCNELSTTLKDYCYHMENDAIVSLDNLRNIQAAKEIFDKSKKTGKDCETFMSSIHTAVSSTEIKDTNTSYGMQCLIQLKTKTNMNDPQHLKNLYEEGHQWLTVPKRPYKLSFWERFGGYICGGLAIAGGAGLCAIGGVLTATGVGAVFGLPLIIAGGVSAAAGLGMITTNAVWNCVSDAKQEAEQTGANVRGGTNSKLYRGELGKKERGNTSPSRNIVSDISLESRKYEGSMLSPQQQEPVIGNMHETTPTHCILNKL